MQYDLAVKFRDAPELLITLSDSDLARDWLYLFNINLERSAPLFRDSVAYSLERLNQLAKQAQQELGWNWNIHDSIGFKDTTQMHKDIENYLSRGYRNITEGQDYLLHEIHICLHFCQQGNLRTSMQLEWFNDDGFSLHGYDFKFSHDNTLGAVWLQNPYVGHPPDWIWKQNDHTNVWQTCRFHDWVRPGLVINMQGSIEPSQRPFDQDAYLEWWQTNAPEFIAYHGASHMLANVGHPVIGYVINNQDLLPLQQSEKIEFEYAKLRPGFDPKPSRQSPIKSCAINEIDYQNLCGPDWPDYTKFKQDPGSYPTVLQEIKDMTGIKVLKSVLG